MSSRAALGAAVTQTSTPDWRPLQRALGESLLPGFMWMSELHLESGEVIHAYKHRLTRVYLHLGDDGQAYAHRWSRSGCRYEETSLACALTSVFSSWSVLDASEEDVRAIHAVIPLPRR